MESTEKNEITKNSLILFFSAERQKKKKKESKKMKKEALTRRQNALRLAWVLYNSVGELERKKLAKILNYEEKQLETDIRDLQAYLDELDEEID